MGGRTNKRGIAERKKQLKKQAKKMKKRPKKRKMEGKEKEYTNPKGNTYKRFFRSGKRISDKTTCREDPDGYRILRRPNSSEIEFKYKGKDSYCYRKRLKKSKKNYNK